MKLLLVGGSGMVGTFITPYLARHHTLRVLDLRPPSADGVEYVEGSITDPGTVRRALEGCDSFINLVMNGAQGGASTDQSIPLILSNYEVNTVGLHLLAVHCPRPWHSPGSAHEHHERPLPRPPLVPPGRGRPPRHTQRVRFD